MPTIGNPNIWININAKDNTKSTFSTIVNKARYTAKQISNSFAKTSKKMTNWSASISSSMPKSLTTSAKQSVGVIEGFRNRIGRIAEMIGHYLTFTIGVQIVMGTVRAIKGVITNIIEFQRAATNAASISGYLGDSFEAVRNHIEKVSRELGRTTVFTAKDAANAFYNLASAGWNVSKIGKKELLPILNYAAAVQIDLTDATYQITTALKQFNLTMEDTGKIADVFTAGIANSYLNADRLREGMKYLGPVMGSLGKSIEETVALLGALANKGFEGGQSGRYLSLVLTRLLAPTAKVKKGLEEMGLTLDDVNPSIHSTVEILTTLKEAGFDATKAAQMFGTRSAKAAIAIAGSADEVAYLNEKIKYSGNIAENVAKKQINTLWGAMKLLRSALQETGLSLSGFVIPILVNMANFLRTDIIPVLHTITSLLSDFIGLMPKGVHLGRTLAGIITLLSVSIIGLWLSLSAIAAISPKVIASLQAQGVVEAELITTQTGLTKASIVFGATLKKLFPLLFEISILYMAISEMGKSLGSNFEKFSKYIFLVAASFLFLSSSAGKAVISLYGLTEPLLLLNSAILPLGALLISIAVLTKHWSTMSKVSKSLSSVLFGLLATITLLSLTMRILGARVLGTVTKGFIGLDLGAKGLSISVKTLATNFALLASSISMALIIPIITKDLNNLNKLVLSSIVLIPILATEFIAFGIALDANPIMAIAHAIAILIIGISYLITNFNTLIESTKKVSDAMWNLGDKFKYGGIQLKILAFYTRAQIELLKDLGKALGVLNEREDSDAKITADLNRSMALLWMALDYATYSANKLKEAQDKLNSGTGDITKITQDYALALQMVEDSQAMVSTELHAIIEATKAYNTKTNELVTSLVDMIDAEHEINNLTEESASSYKTLQQKTEDYSNAVALYGENSNEAKKALTDLMNAQSNYENIQNKIATNQEKITKGNRDLKEYWDRNVGGSKMTYEQFKELIDEVKDWQDMNTELKLDQAKYNAALEISNNYFKTYIKRVKNATDAAKKLYDIQKKSWELDDKRRKALDELMKELAKEGALSSDQISSYMNLKREQMSMTRARIKYNKLIAQGYTEEEAKQLSGLDSITNKYNTDFENVGNTLGYVAENTIKAGTSTQGLEDAYSNWLNLGTQSISITNSLNDATQTYINNLIGLVKYNARAFKIGLNPDNIDEFKKKLDELGLSYKEDTKTGVIYMTDSMDIWNYSLNQYAKTLGISTDNLKEQLGITKNGSGILSDYGYTLDYINTLIADEQSNTETLTGYQESLNNITEKIDNTYGNLNTTLYNTLETLTGITTLSPDASGWVAYFSQVDTTGDKAVNDIINKFETLNTWLAQNHLTLYLDIETGDTKTAEYFGQKIGQTIVASALSMASFGLIPATAFMNMLPTTANGGIITQPSIRTIAEAGPEVIIPLSDLSKYYEPPVINITTPENGQSINIYGDIHIDNVSDVDGFIEELRNRASTSV